MTIFILPLPYRWWTTTEPLVTSRNIICINDLFQLIVVYSILVHEMHRNTLSEDTYLKLMKYSLIHAFHVPKLKKLLKWIPSKEVICNELELLQEE